MALQKVDLETPQPGGRLGEPTRTAWRKQNENLDEIELLVAAAHLAGAAAAAGLAELETSLGDAAFAASTSFATAGQGSLASTAIQPSQLTVATDRLQAQFETLAASQQVSAIYAATLADLQAAVGTYVNQGAFVANGAGAGQYRWNGASWQFLRADMLTTKADRAQVDQIAAWKASSESALDVLMKSALLGLTTWPPASEPGAAGYTFVAPHQAPFAGVVDQIEVFGGEVGGEVTVKIFGGSGSTLNEVSRATINVLPDVMNVVPVALSIAPGQRIGLFFPDKSVAYSYNTGASHRAWRAAGNATSVDTSTALRIVALMMRARVRAAAYNPPQMERAITAGEIMEDAINAYSVAVRRPLILDLDGMLGPADSLYVPRALTFSREATVSVTAANPAVTMVAGGYARISLSPSAGWWDIGATNTVYYDPADNLIKMLSGDAGPTDQLLTSVVPMFQITGRNGGWRSASGLNVEVRKRPEGRAALADVYDQVMSPMRDCRIAMVGDSNTWGLRASGIAESEPRTPLHSLSNPRDNFISGSYANRLRRHFAKVAVDLGNETSPTPGMSVYSRPVAVMPRYDSNFQAMLSSGVVPRDPGGANTGAGSKRYIDSPNDVVGGRIAFTYVGGDIELIHARLEGGVYEFYVDGVLVKTFNYFPPIGFGQGTVLTGIPFGRHFVEVVATTSQIFRLQEVRRTKVCSFANNGIIGTNTAQWLPGGSLLKDAVPQDTTLIFDMLGTNSRGMPAGSDYPAGAMGVYQNNIDRFAWYRSSRPNATVIVLSPIFTPANVGDVSSGDVAVAVRRSAKAMGLAFIDVWGLTYGLHQAGIDWLNSDNIHLSNNGHRLVYEFIWSQIASAADL